MAKKVVHKMKQSWMFDYPLCQQGMCCYVVDMNNKWKHVTCKRCKKMRKK